MDKQNKTTKKTFKPGIYTFMWGDNMWDAGKYGVRGQMIDSDCHRHEVRTTPASKGVPFIVRKGKLEEPVIERHEARRVQTLDECLPQLSYVVHKSDGSQACELVGTTDFVGAMTSETRKADAKYRLSGYSLIPVSCVSDKVRGQLPMSGVVGIPPKGAMECQINTFQEWTIVAASGFGGLALGSWSRPQARTRSLHKLGDDFPVELERV